MLGKSASVGEVARTIGLTRQTVYRIKGDPGAAEAALATWGI
jgi:putative DNA-invertase from lambdoid prophage Rac